MRSAIVVVPVCASLAAGALLGLQLRTRSAPRPVVVVAPVPVVVRSPVGPPRDQREHPIGGQYLEANLLLAYADMPPMLLEPHTGDDAFRYGWRYETLARAMAKELADVLDDACPTGCTQAAAAREALQTWLDAGSVTETHTLKRWKTDDDVAPTYLRRLTVRTAAGTVGLEITCTATSDYLGMRAWNDEASCDATLRDGGRLLATYKPRQLTVLDRDTYVHPIDAWEQTVTFAAGEITIRTPKRENAASTRRPS